MEFTAVATCLFGLEKIVEFELKKAGATNTTVENGRIFFTATAGTVASVNICSRSAERILIVLSRFNAADFDTLFDEVRSVEWGCYIDRTDAFPVKGYSINSQLSSVPAMQSVIKKAIVERLKKDHNSQFLTEKSGITKRVRFSMTDNECLIMMDTSGDGLHKRGYRRVSNNAPIKETLAAGIVDLARIKDNSLVVDPFCGSGTLLIEAAMKAKNIAPGLSRKFAAEEYGFLGKDNFNEARQKAKEQIKKDVTFFARGYDIDSSSIEVAANNAKIAGVDKLIRFEAADSRDLKVTEKEIILTNPPYGERLMSVDESTKLMREFFGNLSKQKYKGLYIISNNIELEKTVNRVSTKRRKLYNGMIPCTLYMYY